MIASPADAGAGARLALLTVLCVSFFACAPKPGVTLSRDDAAGRITVLVGGREALVFQCGPDLDMVHYWPLRSPGGRNMLVQKTEPYPHHRSFWFADTVRVEGGERDLSFYNGLYSGVKAESGDYGPVFRDRIRLVSFPRLEAAKGRAEIDAELVWESDGRPVLDEARRLVVHSLGDGEYLLDQTWTLTAAYGA
ncbi:MAG: PmoA family protein, partial [Candidatus Aminicenantes bacterium]|nr:PmoA family protein [Candidatus Aminicenantes bacterium]